MQSLLFDFLKVTEIAAIASKPWVGSGDKISADGAATKAMREQLNKMEIDGTVVIGEGEIDEAPMLYIGEKVGLGIALAVDIAVDPIEGTTPTVNGQPNAITVIAAAPQGTLLHAPDMYMKKMVVGPNAKGVIDIEATLDINLSRVADATGKNIEDLNILIQDRPRHQKYIDEIRNIGANVNLFSDGDVIYAAATCMEDLDIDMFYGIGGAPEGVLGAVASRCLGGEMQAKLIPRNEDEIRRCNEMGIYELEAPLRHQQLVSTDDCIFSATGITSNIFLKGIQCKNEHYITHSVLADGKSKQLRYIESNYPIMQLV
ncbi:class II fructose-bisphosphatase [Oceanobacillus sp. 1P07AA]|uniref:class II fructose-bisphosphatase n=1 Tax=Oceanobacillus sp. 1P07AA TaxID=3132293 RepID=UPI0039A4A7AE